MNMTSEMEKQLVVLRSEVELDCEGLASALEAGTQMVLVTDRALGNDLSPDHFRTIGRIVMLCNHYGAMITFVNKMKSLEIFGKPPTKE